MANKYANLVGTNKIKDEYTKINTGFDGVETDIDALNDLVDALDSRVDTIITTPIDGEAAAQEIVDARVSAVKSKTFATLDARFEETEQDIATHMADNVTDADGAHGLKIESGTWTPVLFGMTTPGTPTYTQQAGIYRKIDNIVFIWLRIILSNKGGLKGNVRISGLPFTTPNRQYSLSVAQVSNLSFLSTQQYVAQTTLNSDVVALLYMNSGATISNIQETDISDTFDINLSGFYIL